MTGLGLLAGLMAAAPFLASFRQSGTRRVIETARVRRVSSLKTTITAAGRAASTNNTEIRCALERMSATGSSGSRDATASTIISVIADGTTVKKGDLLCELDASAYVEMVRQQEIAVKQAAAEKLQADLNLSIAQINLQSFKEGTLKQTEQQSLGQLALTKSDLSRQKDRLAWMRRMYEKGYGSVAQVTGEEQALRKLDLTLAQAELSYENYKRFSVPKELRSLQSAIDAALSTEKFQATRLKLAEDRLALLKLQVERCRILAPHDGLLIYYEEPRRPSQIWEGATVRQRQQMFTLPDLGQMEVQALLHETVVDRIRAGMPATARFEALPGRSVDGQVTHITQFPLLDRSDNAKNDVKYYLSRIKLDRPLEGLRPGMTAEVEITAETRSMVTVVPPGAVMSKDGQDVCYLVRPEGFERRAVKIGQQTANLFEITEGLEAGDVVLLEPAEVFPAAVLAGRDFVPSNSTIGMQ